MAELIAVDLGFGNVKVKNGLNEYLFQSVVGNARRLIDSTVSSQTSLQHIVDLKRNLFIGDLALRQSATKIFSLKENKAGHESTLPLLETSLGIAAHSNQVNIVTGLPVTFYFEQKDALQKVLCRDHDVNIQFGKEWIERPISVLETKVIPQPLGAALDFLLDDRGNIKEGVKEYASGRIGVLDIGFYTNDLLVIDGLEVVQDYSRSLRSGMSVAYKAMNDAGIDLPIYELEKVVRLGGYEEASYKAFHALAKQVSGEVETYWPQLDLIIVTGGGGKQLYTFLELPGVTKLASNPPMSNVRGYYKLGKRTWKE